MWTLDHWVAVKALHSWEARHGNGHEVLSSNPRKHYLGLVTLFSQIFDVSMRDLNDDFQAWIWSESNFWNISLSNTILWYWNKNMPLIWFGFCFEEDKTRHISYDPDFVFEALVKLDNDVIKTCTFFQSDYCPFPFPSSLAQALPLIYFLIPFTPSLPHQTAEEHVMNRGITPPDGRRTNWASGCWGQRLLNPLGKDPH